MHTLQQRTVEQLKLFSETNDSNALSEALNILAALQPKAEASTMERKTLRSEKLKLLLEVLEHIDSHTEVNFDSQDVPSLNISPPPETGLPSGVDPAAIKDPQLRAQYERDLSANQKKAKNYALQKRLRQLNRKATTQTEDHVNNTYSSSAEDLAELDKLIDEVISLEQRKVSLKQFARTLQER